MMQPSSLRCAFLLALLSCSSLLPTTHAHVVTAREYATAINIAGRQRMLSQKMSKEFFLVAKKIDTSQSKASMLETIANFDNSLAALNCGDNDMGIPRPPTPAVSDQLTMLSPLWNTFKVLLRRNVDVDPIPAAVLAEVAAQSVPLLAEANRVVQHYVAAAMSAGVTVPGTTVDVAGRQRMLSQKMTKEALLVALRMDVDVNEANLKETMDDFQSSHTGLLDGDLDRGLTETTDVCILQQMQKVSDLWLEFEPLLLPLAAGGMAADDDLQQIAEMSPVVLATMNDAVWLYAASRPTCHNTFSVQQFSTAINIAGRQRMLTQRMSKEFLLVAKGIDVLANAQNMANTIRLFEDSLKNLIQGSTADHLPAAPNQDIADQLFVVKGLWDPFKVLLEDSLASGNFSVSVLESVATQCLPLLAQANTAVTLYVAAAAKIGAPVPGSAVNIAGRQRMLSQKMTKEALLVALDVDRDANTGNLKATMELFAASHVGLLDGDSDTDPVLPPTTEACALQQMQKVSDLWVSFQQLLAPIAAGHVPLNAELEEIAALSPVVLTTMNTAVGFYASSMPTCDNAFPADHWATALRVAGRQGMLSQKIPKEFLLAAKGVNVAVNKQSLAETMDEFDASLKKLIQGSTVDTLPAAPTQQVADRLVVLSRSWAKFKALLEDHVDTDGESVILVHTLNSMDSQSQALLGQAEAVVSSYLAAALAAGTAPPEANATLVAGRQGVLSQKMAKEALLVASFVERADNRNQLKASMETFTDRHSCLVRGSRAHGVPATTNECILSQMHTVNGVWGDLRGILAVVRDGGKITETMLEKIAQLNLDLLSESNEAQDMYAQGAAMECDEASRGFISGVARERKALPVAATAAVLAVAWLFL